MPLHNLVTLEFTDEEAKEIDMALKVLEKHFKKKMINLTPEEKQKYARPKDSHKDFLKKIQMYMNQKKELIPVYLNQEDFEKDMKAKDFLENLEKRLLSIKEMVDDTSILLGTDIQEAASVFYQHIKMAAKQEVPGATSIYQELSKQYPHGFKSKKKKTGNI